MVIFLLLFCLSSSTYSEQQALLLLHASYASFCQRDIVSWTCFPCTHSYKMQNVTLLTTGSQQVFGFFGYNISTHEMCTIASDIDFVLRATTQVQSQRTTSMFSAGESEFRGTKESQMTCEGCMVNTKMKDLADQVKDEVISTVRKGYNGQYYYLKVAGYGMGAGILTILLAYLHCNGLHAQQFYTFGSPRVGNYLFASWFDNMPGIQPSLRVVNHADSVARYGFSLFSKYSKTKTYKHIRHEVYYQDSNYTLCKDQIDEDPHCSDKLLFGRWDDHFTYLKTNFNLQTKLCSGVDAP